jgi:putative metal-binding protein/pre-peptidase
MRPKRLLLVLLMIGLGSLGSAYANWTASGTFRYVDREFDQNGFTGVEPAIPIRLATVEVREFNKGVLATGSTDANGNFSIFVSDNKTRTVYVRVLSASTAVSGLFLKVQNEISPKVVYAVASGNTSNHNPSTNVNFGTVTAAIGSGGEAFNLYDTGLRAVDYIAHLNGARPGSSQTLILEWQNGFGQPASSFDPSTLTIDVGDNSGYNDTVVAHETGHYAYQLYSANDNPGGTHHLLDCNQDLRLAYDEGRATWFGQATRAYFGLPRPDLYVKTTGAPGAGNLDFYFNVETETPYYCDGASSEVAVYAALWDINDTSSTADGSPGVDDDSLSRPDTDNWDVDKNYIPSASNRSLEDFWDGWFLRGKGFQSNMISGFQRTNVEFYLDASEPNNSVAAASPVTASGNPIHLTYFADSNGDGAGEPDNDYFSLSATAATAYTIETLNLWGRANTSLQLLASDGSTVLASNDDRAAGDPSSLINYTASSSGTLYIRSFHATDLGIYGSYDLRISGGPPVDADGDGYFSDVDCNDSNPAIHPGAAEVCNGVDDNCVNGIDEGFDVDGDGYTTCAGDCNDSNAAIHPGAVEVCNGVDDNCVNGIDEGFDLDGDGYTTCAGDCNDSNAAVHPGATELCSNGIDDDCNNLTDSQDPACNIDTVVITKAEWKSAGRKLTVQATSTQAPQAILTLVGYGTMTYDSATNLYTFTRNNTSNPGTVTVTSSKGGSATSPVTPI